jgi:hypothetical protein
MRRRLLIVAGVILVAALCIRVEHLQLGWGNNWTVDFVPPWR